MPEPTGRYPVLSDWTAPRIIAACTKCGRRDVHRTDDIREMVGPERTLVEVRLALTADCPRAIKKDFSDWCAGMLKPEG